MYIIGLMTYRVYDYVVGNYLFKHRSKATKRKEMKTIENTNLPIKLTHVEQTLKDIVVNRHTTLNHIPLNSELCSYQIGVWCCLNGYLDLLHELNRTTKNFNRHIRDFLTYSVKGNSLYVIEYLISIVDDSDEFCTFATSTIINENKPDCLELLLKNWNDNIVFSKLNLDFALRTNRIAISEILEDYGYKLINSRGVKHPITVVPVSLECYIPEDDNSDLLDLIGTRVYITHMNTYCKCVVDGINKSIIDIEINDFDLKPYTVRVIEPTELIGVIIPVTVDQILNGVSDVE